MFSHGASNVTHEGLPRTSPGTLVQSLLLRQRFHQSKEGIEYHSGTSHANVFLIAADQLMTPVCNGDSITWTSQCFDFYLAKGKGT